ncbi:LOW QUALITY PROTEIN: hypothetical protein MXB_3981 [Myxobolus squamalis]|nr:LOW QUALITY PROTEIN: hypothetical protein MXB_3981 [Myxobolus squamalis]
MEFLINFDLYGLGDIKFKKAFIRSYDPSRLQSPLKKESHLIEYDCKIADICAPTGRNSSIKKWGLEYMLMEERNRIGGDFSCELSSPRNFLPSYIDQLERIKQVMETPVIKPPDFLDHQILIRANNSNFNTSLIKVTFFYFSYKTGGNVLYVSHITSYLLKSDKLCPELRSRVAMLLYAIFFEAFGLGFMVFQLFKHLVVMILPCYLLGLGQFHSLPITSFKRQNLAGNLTLLILKIELYRAIVCWLCVSTPLD